MVCPPYAGELFFMSIDIARRASYSSQPVMIMWGGTLYKKIVWRYGRHKRSTPTTTTVHHNYIVISA